MQISFNVTVYNPLKSRVGVSKAPFVDFFIMDFFRKYLLGCFITFIFQWCGCNSAVVIPVKYECDNQ